MRQCQLILFQIRFQAELRLCLVGTLRPANATPRFRLAPKGPLRALCLKARHSCTRFAADLELAREFDDRGPLPRGTCPSKRLSERLLNWVHERHPIGHGLA